MSRTITSGNVTFVDLSDNRKLDAYITSNLPTTQIYNQNEKKYIPNWSETNLKLSADIYLDSKEVTDNSYVSIIWYQKIGTQSKTQVGTGITLTVNSNQLTSSVGTITYICEATYNDTTTNPPTAHAEIIFTRTDTGLNGTDGADGTSVNIKGTATAATQVEGTDYYTITYSDTAITAAEEGDAYLFDGDLYVCISARDGADYFINVGNIRGPAGADGRDAKSIVLSGDSQVFKVSQSNVVTPSIITVTAQAFNTTVTNWTYSTNGGQTFLSTAPTGVSRNGNVVTITGSSLTSNSLTIKASDGTIEDVFTIYKAFDGNDGNPGDPGDPAPISFLTNENVTFSANANGQITGTTITSNVVAYNGTTKVTPTIGTISGAPTGMTITPSTIAASNEVMLTITIANNSTLGSTSSNMGTISIPVTYPVSTVLYLTWSKVNTGATGIGIASTTVSYGESDSSSVQPTSWQSAIPDVAEGKYLWTRTIIDYTDTNKADTVTYTYAKQGVKGDEGKTGTSVTVSSIQYQEGTSATVTPTGTWSNSVVAVAEGKFLWTKTAFSDGKVAYGVARQGIDGGDGRGITSIVEQYYQSTSATAQSGGSWSTTAPTWADGKYVWTRSVITYTDSTTSTTSPVCITGQKGSIGNTGVGVTSVDVWYYQSTSATSLSGGSWSTTAPTWSDGKYVWTKTITTYTNNTTDETTAVCITGQKGSTGVGVKSVTEYYLATSASSDVTTSTLGWTTTVQTITSDKKYLWNYEIITYTNNTTSTTTPVIIGVFGNTGNTGKGIKSVTEYYLATSSSSDVTTSTSGWTLAIQTLTATKKYLWNYELITYTDNTTTTINPIIIGVYGDQGTPAISVMLSSEVHLFEADTQGVPVPTSITFDVIGYQGLAQSATTVGTITGLPSAGMTITILNNGTTSTQIQIAVTESLTSVDSGTLTIPVTVNGKVVNKKFNWKKSKEGLMGERGTDAITFQVYSTDGYVLSKDIPSITLQTIAYNGDVPIEAGATYQWYKYSSGNWVAITNATNGYLKISHSDVSFNSSYMCKMLFNNIEYVGVATIDDKSDTNIIFTSKPSSYAAGDIWIVGGDYAPSGVVTGTVLKAEYPNNTYNDTDWIVATKYDKVLDDINKHIDTYNQYFDFDDEDGLRITARDKNNIESKFSTVLTNERLAFNYGDDSIAYINGTSMHIKEAEIESPLTVTGKYSGSTMLQAPIINIGNFSIVVESNGSLSIVSNI